MKKFIKYAVGIIIPLAAGGVSALLTSGQMYGIAMAFTHVRLFHH